MMKPSAICDASMDPGGSATLLRRHTINYYRCATCGLLQTETFLTGRLAYPAAIYIRRMLGSKTLSDHAALMRVAAR